MESKRAVKISGLFLWLSEFLEPFFLDLKIDLIQSKNKTTPKKYIALSVYGSVYSTLLVVTTLIFLGFILENEMLWDVGFIFTPIIFLFVFFSMMLKPKVVARKRAREIEKELPYALRHLLIEVKSGIPLYQAMVSVSEKYEAASREIKDIIKEINAGTSPTDAIEQSVLKNPSRFYRRVFWQLSNALKTGADIEKTLQATVEDIIREQLLAIKKYGQELNPWTLIYMMVAVIVPSLGITFLMILSSFTGISLSVEIFILILLGLAMFQAMFMKFVSTKRPMVKL